MNEFLLENDSELAKLLNENLAEDFKPADLVQQSASMHESNPVRDVLLDAICYSEECLNGFNRIEKDSEQGFNNSFEWLVVITTIIAISISLTGSASSGLIGCVLLVIFTYLSFTYDQRRLHSLQQLLQDVKALDNLFKKSKKYIQEMEVLSRGYRLGAKLPPLERLEASVKARSALHLRSKLIQACNIFLENDEIPEGDISLQSIKNAIKRMNCKRIEQYYRWLDECQNTKFPSIALHEEISRMKCLVKAARMLLEEGLDTLMLPYSKVQLKRAAPLDTLHLKLEHMHTAAMLFLENQPQMKDSARVYLRNLSAQIAELEKLCFDQLQGLDRLQEQIPTEMSTAAEGSVREFVPGQLNSNQAPGQQTINFNTVDWKSNQPCLLAEAEVFEADLKLLQSTPARSKLSREQRLLKARFEKAEIAKLKEQKGSEMELISELASVLKSRGTNALEN